MVGGQVARDEGLATGRRDAPRPSDQVETGRARREPLEPVENGEDEDGVDVRVENALRGVQVRHTRQVGLVELFWGKLALVLIVI